jgi:hypothetical protein
MSEDKHLVADLEDRSLDERESTAVYTTIAVEAL